MRVTCNWRLSSNISTLAFFDEVILVVVSEQHLNICSAYPTLQLKVVLFFISNSLPVLLTNLIQGFLYCPPCGQVPVCSTLCAWHSTSAEPQTCEFMLTCGFLQWGTSRMFTTVWPQDYNIGIASSMYYGSYPLFFCPVADTLLPVWSQQAGWAPSQYPQACRSGNNDKKGECGLVTCSALLELF